LLAMKRASAARRAGWAASWLDGRRRSDAMVKGQLPGCTVRPWANDRSHELGQQLEYYLPGQRASVDGTYVTPHMDVPPGSDRAGFLRPTCRIESASGLHGAGCRLASKHAAWCHGVPVMCDRLMADRYHTSRNPVQSDIVPALGRKRT
jgi:hypothetical protein